MGDTRDAMPPDEPEGDPLDAGLRAAFGLGSTAGWGGESILAVFERDCGISSHLLLNDGPDDASGLISPVAPGPGDAYRGIGRYLIAGEIARGGVGVVFKGRDTDLGREVAIKTLRAEYAGEPAMVRRLIEEAQIGGQLQHPGVLPVYEMGLDPGRRPFFTMKLVRGQTLASLLNNRTSPVEQRRRLLAEFEKVCQTVAYAHARGVVHRDLKPANVMVGSYGEVQVVDWGLAKVLARGGVADEPRAEERDTAAEEAAIATARSVAPGSRSEAGSILGTPAYMPPEQARGEVDGLDERCDVFALGAMLCEILTGKPPYVGPRHEVLSQAAEGRLADAFARLEASGADAELVRLSRSCLSVDRVQRPRDAGVVARAVSAYLASAEERLRRAETDAAIARARAAAERRARRLTLAAGVLALLVVLIGGGAYIQAERQGVQAEQQRIARLHNALVLIASLDMKGRWLLNQAAATSGPDAERWVECLTLTEQALRHTLALEADPSARRRSLNLLSELQAAEKAARVRAAWPHAERPRDAGR
jgi:serine/threonine-protein kinase